MARVILHSDANSFYTSVECLHRPDVRNGPLSVYGDPEMRHGMQELGYFSPEKLTPNYTTVTAQRVTMFQEANGLHLTCDANEATLNALYADTAVRNPNKL